MSVVEPVAHGGALLLVDHDDIVRRALARGLRERGHGVIEARSVAEAAACVVQHPVARCLLELRLPDGLALDLLHRWRLADGGGVVPSVIVWSGYGSIAAATQAIRLGAVDFLPKPAEVDEVLGAFARHEAGARSRAAGERVNGHGARPWGAATNGHGGSNGSAGDDVVGATGNGWSHTPSLARTEWEHINRVLFDSGHNISEAARRLKIHRRSLQRKLQKYPPSV